VALAGGCSQLPRAPDAAVGSGERDCAGLYADVDRAVASARVQDGVAARIEDFPYLRVNRFLASFASETLNDAQFVEWVGRLGELDRTARAFEVANLPAPERRRLHAGDGSLEQSLDRCREVLSAADLASAERRAVLPGRAQVDDDYDTWKRVLGLYWITRLPFASGVQGYQEEVGRTFRTPLERLPVRGRLVAYSDGGQTRLTQSEVQAILVRASANPLRIPDPEPDDAERLFTTFAPRWIVDERDANDRIGRLVLSAQGRVEVDTSAPVVYRRIAHVRVGTDPVLQLVYSVWFPARPRTSTFDLLGGHLDGIIWRVTLAPDGAPLVFDSIHSCGCYHQFFPTPRARPRPAPDTVEEVAFIPQFLDATFERQPVTLRVEAGTHYLQRVSVGASEPGDAGYRFAADDSLRSLSQPGGTRRSVFAPDGIVPGSERGERYFFWPMGVPEPGAMRQWGRHPTAFIGRRHFDEARLLERYFELDLH
jgi:hypothetical protein